MSYSQSYMDSTMAIFKVDTGFYTGTVLWVE